MNVFKEETEIKRIIFNVRLDLAERLEKAKEDSRSIGKKLDIDTAVNKAIEKFLKKAEKKIAEIQSKSEGSVKLDEYRKDKTNRPDDETVSSTAKK